MHDLTQAHPELLTVIQLPAYSAELNPFGGRLDKHENGLGNLTACSADQLAAIVRTRLSASSTGRRSSTDSSPRPVSLSNQNRRRSQTPTYQPK